MAQTKTNTVVRKQEDTHMRAIVYHTYGSPDVLKLEDIQKPIPQDDEVLVQVHAASVNAGDCFLLRGKARMMGFGLLKPKKTILGSDIAGGLKQLAETSHSFTQVMRSSQTQPSMVLAVLPNMSLSLKLLRPSNRPISRLRKQQPCLKRLSPPCRVCAIKDTFRRGRRC